MTVAEFRELPEHTGSVYHELRHGELVAVTRPKLRRIRIQKRLERLLEAVAGETGTVIMELSFRALPEHELRVADVAYVSRDRWELSDPEDNLGGARVGD
jgi:Uma2 family endonuclease